MWRNRSRLVWLKLGDASSNYFFKLVTAKRIRESIKTLALSDGRLTEDKSEILIRVYDHYRELYKRDLNVARHADVRAEVLALIAKTFTEQDNQILRTPPDAEEIEKVVLGFPKGKSPGEDGVTYDFLQESWELVGACCSDMVLAFWQDAKLSANTVNGIVKMIPKLSDF